jgi:hypothetical protein
MALSQAATVADEYRSETQKAKTGFAGDEAFMRPSKLATRSILVPLFLALFGSALGQSFPGQGQGALWTAPGNLGSTPAVVYADAFTGSDPCAQINAAIAALPPTGGVVDARAFQGGPLTCASNPFPVAANLGTISVSTTVNPTTVTGSGVVWVNGPAGSHAGAAIFCGNPPATFLGIIASVTPPTTLTLTKNTLANCSGAYSITVKSGELLLGNATYALQYSWIIPDRWRVIGSGRGFSSPLGNPTGTGTSLQATSGFGPPITAGSISSMIGTTGISGTGTSWDSSLVGDILISGATSSTPIQGVIATVTPMNALTLSTPAQNTHSGPYAILPPLIQFRATNSTLYSTTSPTLASGVSVSNLMVDCNGLNGGLGIQNWWAQELSHVQDVNISECSGISLDIETITAQNSGPYSDIASSVDSAGRANPNTLCIELLKTGDLRGVHGITCIGSLSTGNPNVGFDLSTQSTTLEDLHFEGYTTGIAVGANAVANNVTIINATGGTGQAGESILVDIANTSNNAPFVNQNEVNLLGLNTGGVATILSDDIMGTVLSNTTDPSLALYSLGQGSGRNRARFSTSPSVTNLIGGGTLSATNASGGGVSAVGSNGVGTGNGGSVTIQAGGFNGTGANGTLQVLQPFTKGSTVTLNNLECLSATNTVSDCTAGTGNFVGVAAASSGNTVFVLTHGVVNVNITNPPSSPGDFICQIATGQAKDNVGACAVTNAVGIATTSAATSPIPVLITRF